MQQRRFPRRLAAPAFGLGLLALSGPGLPTAAAAAPPVVVGDVLVLPEGAAAEATPELRRALRATLAEELRSLSQQGLVVEHPLVLTATLTQLSSERRERQAKATASISLALRRADDQVLFAELRGRCSAEDASGTLASVRRDALRGAVRGALKRLPEAVRRPR